MELTPRMNFVASPSAAVTAEQGLHSVLVWNSLSTNEIKGVQK